MSLPETFPPPVAAPCRECPWRRNSVNGHLGPHSARDWIAQAHGETIIACHMTIKDVEPGGNGDWNHPVMRQCRGAAIFRENVGKNHRRPDVESGPRDTETVFASNDEFINHHEGNGMERQVTISGSKEDLERMTEALLKQVQGGHDATAYVKGNGNAEPNLVLNLSVESVFDDEDEAGLLAEWTEQPS